MGKPTRAFAYDLLTEFNDNEALIKHALAVEGVMRRFARITGEDEEKWGAIGLLHDLDYQKFPDMHCAKTAGIMKERGLDDEYIHAAVSHGFGICSDVEPIHFMEKILYTIDELTGLINASVIMRPDKNIGNFEFKSLNKKFKQPSFAAGVDRALIVRGVNALSEADPSYTFEYVCIETINGMKDVAGAIGLDGSAGS